MGIYCEASGMCFFETLEWCEVLVTRSLSSPEQKKKLGPPLRRSRDSFIVDDRRRKSVIFAPILYLIVVAYSILAVWIIFMSKKSGKKYIDSSESEGEIGDDM